MGPKGLSRFAAPSWGFFPWKPPWVPRWNLGRRDAQQEAWGLQAGKLQVFLYAQTSVGDVEAPSPSSILDRRYGLRRSPAQYEMSSRAFPRLLG